MSGTRPTFILNNFYPLCIPLPKVRIILNSLYMLYTAGSIGRDLYRIGICTVFQKDLKWVVISATLNLSRKGMMIWKTRSAIFVAAIF